MTTTRKTASFLNLTFNLCRRSAHECSAYAGANPVRGRRPPELHEDRADHARLRRPAIRHRRHAGAHRPALRRGDEARAVRAAEDSRARYRPRRGLGLARRADRRDHEALRAGAGRHPAARRAGGGRRELDHRLRAGGGEEGHRGDPRRGRPAQRRPRHAGRDQPRAHRPDLRPAVHHRALGAKPTCCARVSRRSASTSWAT